jgi:hypothetical protein
VTRQRRGTPLSRGRHGFQGHRRQSDHPGRVIRVTLWGPDREQFAAATLTMCMAEDALRPGVTLEGLADEFRMKRGDSDTGTENIGTHQFITTQIVRIADTSDEQRNVELALAHADLEAEQNQAIMFYWTAFHLAKKVRPGGIVANSQVSPLTAGQISEVFRQLSITEFFQGHTIVSYSNDGMTVTLRPDGEVHTVDGTPF